LDANGAYITHDDDSGGGLNSFISYSVPTTGWYFILASQYMGQSGNGSYTLSLNLFEPIPFREAFPDANFRAVVLRVLNNMDYGYRNDESIMSADDMAILTSFGYLDVLDMGIRDMTGLSYFNGLRVFYCEYNYLTTLDVSNNTSLEYLYCIQNNMQNPDDVIGWREIGLELGHNFYFYPQNIFVPVTDIINAPEEVTEGVPCYLYGTVLPTDATNKDIIWSVKDAGETGAIIIDNILYTSNAGILILTATIENGIEVGISYSQDFAFTVMPPFVPVTDIIDVPDQAIAGIPLTLAGSVNPPDATKQTIIWSIKEAGTTGATIAEDTLNTTAAGTVVVTATVKGGQLVADPSSLAASDSCTVALKTDNSLWSWGDDRVLYSNIPARIGMENNWVSIAAKYDHIIALKANGSLWAWGNNGNGQLGDGTNILRNNPVRIGIENDWASISVGVFHTVALKTDGSLWAWGFNGYGQLGDGTSIQSNSPIRIGLENNWSSISAGDSYTMAIKTDGSLWAWGNNDDGQLGDGTNIDRHTPVRIGIENDWSRISAGWYHTMAIKTDGSLWAWGVNWYGQLGDGTNIDRYSPVRIGEANDWATISAGGDHTVALKSNGSLWAWGTNWYGQLGNGTTYNQSTPQRIGVENDWSIISAGRYHTVALKTGSSLWAWGYNIFGQLGDGTSMQRNNPVRIGIENNWGSNRDFTKDFTIEVAPEPNPDYNYTVSLTSHYTSYFYGETILIDLMLSGDLNYTQIAAEIAYDDDLLEYVGYENLQGWIAAVEQNEPGTISIRSIPSANTIHGEPCSPAVKIVTLIFTNKQDTINVNTDLKFTSLFVGPPAGMIGATTAPAKPIALTLGRVSIAHIVYLEGSGNSFDSRNWQNIFTIPGDYSTSRTPSVWYLTYTGNNIASIVNMGLEFTNGYLFNWQPDMDFSRDIDGNNPGWVIEAPAGWELKYNENGNSNESRCHLTSEENRNADFIVTGYSRGIYTDYDTDDDYDIYR